MYHVLIVDNAPMTRKLLELLVSSDTRYVPVPSLDSPLSAAAYCAKYDVDLILMDMATMLDSAGLQTVKTLKYQHPSVRIILMTDVPEYSFIGRAQKVGANSFWYKEPSADSLLHIMDRTMAGYSVYPDSPPVVQLGYAKSTDFTAREMEVLSEIINGKTDAVIAEKLALSVATVKFHIQKIREKTGFKTRTELAVRALDSGLVTLGQEARNS